MTQSVQLQHPEKILLIRFSAIGDLILISHLIRLIHQQYPNARLDLVVKQGYESIYQAHPALRKIWLFQKGELRLLKNKLKQENYSLILDLQGNLKSRMLSIALRGVPVFRTHMYRFRRFLLVRFGLNVYSEIAPVPLRHLKAASCLRLEDDGKGLDLFLPEEKVPQRQWETLAEANFIAVAPGASRATKRWPVDSFHEVADYFLNKGFGVVLLGGSEDRELCQRIIEKQNHSNRIENLAGSLTLMQTASVLQKAGLLISNDTGLMHVASACQIPQIAIFGPTVEAFGFFPFRAHASILEIKDLSCRPCSFHGTESCPKGHFKCMKDISASDVICEAERLLIKDRA